MISSDVRSAMSIEFGNQNKSFLYNLSGKYIVTDFRTKNNEKVRKVGKMCKKYVALRDKMGLQIIVFQKIQVSQNLPLQIGRMVEVSLNLENC